MKLNPAICRTFAERLEEHKEELEELFGKIEQDIDKLPPLWKKRAKMYWLGHMHGALDSEEGGSPMFTMQDTIDDLYNYEEGQGIE